MEWQNTELIPSPIPKLWKYILKTSLFTVLHI
jgi:hypothetical protein